MAFTIHEFQKRLIFKTLITKHIHKTHFEDNAQKNVWYEQKNLAIHSPILFYSILFYSILFYSIIINGQFSSDFNILADKAYLKLYQNSDECISYVQ